MSRIIRIFRVRIKPELKAEFEPLFRTKSVSAVENAAGFVEATLGGPTQWTPNDYTMISTWESEQSLRDFIGDQWNEAHIPESMERFVEACWVDHFSAF